MNNIFLIITPSVFTSTINWAIRKISQDGSLEWTAAFSSDIIMKGLAVDSIEMYAYVGWYANPLDVIRLSATSGALIDAQRQ